MIKRAWQWFRSAGLYSNRLAQIGHTLGGIVIADWFGWHGCVIGITAVLLKESLSDPRPPESDRFFWGGFRDCAFYALGMSIGMLRRWLWLHSL